MKRIRKEYIKNATMTNNNDDNNDSSKLIVRSASISHHTNQACDSEKDLSFTWNHENSRCKDDNNNHRQNKEQYNEPSIANDNDYIRSDMKRNRKEKIEIIMSI